MKKLLFSLLTILSIHAFAQTTVINDANAKARKISGEFTAVSVATGVELYLTQGNEVSLAVSVNDEKYEADFKTEIVNGVLKIYYDNNFKRDQWQKGRRLKAYLSVKSINKLMGSSGSATIFTNTLTANRFDLRLSSGAHFEGALKVTDLDVSQSSGSVANVSGTALNIEIDASSGAAFKAYELTTENCTANVSSGADVHITANKELNASASSGGSIKYKGNATTKDISKSSGGNVKKV